MLDLEQKRTERSDRRFALMLVQSAGPLKDLGTALLDKIAAALFRATRETDFKGWYKDGSILGIIFTEIGSSDPTSVTQTLLGKVQRLLNSVVPPERAAQIRMRCYVFPEDWEGDDGGFLAHLPRAHRAVSLQSKGISAAAKRTIDILGSLLALILLSPLLAAIAIAIKTTSKGPILFRQKRQGRYGRTFTFLKFRSMYVANDPTIHEEYVTRLIQGKEAGMPSEGTKKIYKITEDPRVTPVGRWLRRTSLDELPQFLNVLQGDMSLVGPRPPIPYEVEKYGIWHKRRLLEAKPGMTGLWQVSGRSRTTFDEMVRLDLAYARTWSIWLDLKILFLTPKAVFSGDGAY